MNQKPTFITGAEIAREMCVSTDALYSWVAAAGFPPQRCRPGGRTRLWLRAHWDVFVETGKWPKGAWSSIHR